MDHADFPLLAEYHTLPRRFYCVHIFELSPMPIDMTPRFQEDGAAACAEFRATAASNLHDFPREKCHADSRPSMIEFQQRIDSRQEHDRPLLSTLRLHASHNLRV
jgi:hypothetical protein